jgi:hypothetical protein
MNPDSERHNLEATWELPYSVTLGSSMRKRGIFLEVRDRLLGASKKSLTIVPGGLALRMLCEAEDEFVAASSVVTKSLARIGERPVIPREIEEILAISSTERHRWLKDGRLPSAGTRSVNLRGRARNITFHVFDPRVVEDILDRDIVAEWRETDAVTAAENRRRAAWKSKLTRAAKSAAKSMRNGGDEPLQGWTDFERNGPVR